MLKQIVTLIVLLSAFTLLTAMGGKGAGFEHAPRVEKNFAVHIVDSSGNKIDGEKFSWEGRLHIDGFLGLAQVVIPFEKMKEVSVGEKRDKKMKVTFRLKDGSDTTIEVDADSRCYGEAGFGSFMLPVGEIKTVSFK